MESFYQMCPDRICQMPFMIVGMAICALGAGLVTRLNLITPTAQWATFLVIAGMGLGIAQQMPYAAVQVSLRYGSSTIRRIRFSY